MKKSHRRTKIKGKSFEKCPICGVSLRKKNRMEHYYKAHLEILVIPDTKCPICSCKLDEEHIVCDSHGTDDFRKILVPELYIPMREIVDEIIDSQREAIPTFLFETLPKRVHSFHLARNPLIYDWLTFYGYSISRAQGILTDLGEKHPHFQRRPPTNSFQEKKLFDALYSEYRLLQLVRLAHLDQVRILDTLDKVNRRLFLIPNLTERASMDAMKAYLRDYDMEWSRAQENITWPRGTIEISDRQGRSLHFDSKELDNDFALFSDIWLSHYGNKPPFDSTERHAISRILDELVAPDGVIFSLLQSASQHAVKAEETLNQITLPLEDISRFSSLGITKSIQRLTETLHTLADIGCGFRVEETETIYHLPVRNWYALKTGQVVFDFAQSKQLMGRIFENEVEAWLTLYRETGIGMKPSSSIMGPVVTSHHQPIKRIPLSFRGVLETNYSIEVSDDDKGEIDAIVHANHSLYLLELKAINMNSRDSDRYFRKKAGIQCARYAKWVKGEAFSKMLSKHSIQSKDLHSVRIIVCTLGVGNHMFIEDKATKQEFAVLPLSSLLGLFGGVIMANPSIMNIDHSIFMANAIVTLRKKIELVNVHDPEKRYNAMMRWLYRWVQLATADRREDEIVIKDHPPPNIFNRGRFTWMELLLGGTGKWVLKDPLLIDEIGTTKVYLGTQLATVGSSLICLKCNTVVKYYRSPHQGESEEIARIFEGRDCPFCGEIRVSPKEAPDIWMQVIMCFPKLSGNLLKATFVDDSWLQ